MNKLTGNRDVDSLLLMNLDDRELNIVCESKEYIKSLCDDDKFWLNRNMHIFKLDIETLNKAKEFFEFNTWKELYEYFIVKYRYLL